MESNIQHTELIQSLTQFGLCPFDWSIEVKENNLAVIKNNDEKDFQFLGKLDTTNSHWEYIQLHTI